MPTLQHILQTTREKKAEDTRPSLSAILFCAFLHSGSKMLGAVTRTASGVLRAVKPQVLQNEAAKAIGAFSVNREYIFLEVETCRSCVTFPPSSYVSHAINPFPKPMKIDIKVS